MPRIQDVRKDKPEDPRGGSVWFSLLPGANSNYKVGFHVAKASYLEEQAQSVPQLMLSKGAELEW